MPPGRADNNTLTTDSQRRRYLDFIQVSVHWARQLHLYTLVGGLVFLLDLTVYWSIMHWFGSWFLYAHFMSRTIGGVACFVLNRHITFRKTGTRDLGQDLVRFIVLYAASFILSSILVYTYVSLVQVPPVPGKVIAECTVFLFNYTLMKYWVMPPAKTR
jgi:putative flippase GtrA